MKYPDNEVIQCQGHNSPLLRRFWREICGGSCVDGDPEQQIRVFYAWITTHIRYDYENYLTITGTDVTTPSPTGTDCLAIRALTSRRAMCSGFTDLLYHLCRFSDIVCVKIDGHVKGVEYRPGDVITNSRPNHQWLAVYVGSGWRLLDPTWDCGYVSKRTGQFVSRATSRYLFTSPEAFVRDHLPVDGQWQLLTPADVIDSKAFLNRPIFGPSFEAYRFRCDVKDGIAAVTVGDSYSFSVVCDPDKLRLTADSLTAAVRELASGLIVADWASLTYDNEANTARVKVTPRFPSTFLVELYVIAEGADGHVISVVLTTRTPTSGSPALHTIYSHGRTPYDVTFSDPEPRDGGRITLGVRCAAALELKSFLYRITDRQMTLLRRHVRDCYPERKLAFTVPEDGAYKLVIYGRRRLDTRGSYVKLYTSVNLIKM